jgi:hypothetical protein
VRTFSSITLPFFRAVDAGKCTRQGARVELRADPTHTRVPETTTCIEAKGWGGEAGGKTTKGEDGGIARAPSLTIVDLLNRGGVPHRGSQAASRRIDLSSNLACIEM